MFIERHNLSQYHQCDRKPEQPAAQGEERSLDLYTRSGTWRCGMWPRNGRCRTRTGARRSTGSRYCSPTGFRGCYEQVPFTQKYLHHPNNRQYRLLCSQSCTCTHYKQRITIINSSNQQSSNLYQTLHCSFHMSRSSWQHTIVSLVC